MNKEKRLTFVEWLKEIKLSKGTWHEYNEGTPQHKLKDPSIDEKLSKAYAEGYKDALTYNSKINKVKINMPEGKIDYRP